MTEAASPHRSAVGDATVELLARVAVVADTVLWPAAQVVDRAPILPWSHLEAIAELGLFGQAAPPELGGLGLPAAVARSALRLLGSGCGATGFAFAQHHGVVAALARTANTALRRRWLGPLCGSTLAGIAFAHVRRLGSAAVTATRTNRGWRIHGEAPWATSWGLAELFLVAAVTGEDRILWFLVPGQPAPGFSASERLDLMVLGASATVRLRFDGLEVADEAVVEISNRPGWQVDDRRAAARPNPLCLGVGDRSLSLLAELAPESAVALEPVWVDVARRAEAACAAVDGGTNDVAGVAAMRAETVATVQRLTTATLAAAGGRGAEASHPAQRLAREALFYVVQAQNADGRQATLDRMAGSGNR
jgi:alkylation response protein AidB-like acyl-CoA dehydrogenase